jgi:hypothetical protein
MEREDSAMRVRCLRDAEFGFQFVFSLLECGCIHDHNSTVLAIFPIDQRGQGHHDAIVAGGGVVIQIKKWLAGTIRDFVLEDFEEIKAGGFTTGTTTVLSVIEGLVGFRVPHQLTPFDSQY